jgi:HD-GYP domain-containing protein (c-di-GMP phosphodiesterase class II)
MTEALKLLHPVQAPNGKVLLPAGAALTDHVIAELIHSSRHETFDPLKVMQYGCIADNLHRICHSPPYDKIFSDHARTRSLFALLDQVELPAPIFNIIDFFKSRDPYTYRHVLIVFALALLLAQDFMEDPYELQSAAQACTAHDLGKFCIPLAVLKKKTLLGPSERHSLEHHSAAGYVLLSYFFKDPRHPAAITARDHHERCDGSGYPCGIQLNNRIVEIVAVCDVFDALVAKRPYRPTAYDLRTALEEITDMADRGKIPWDVAKALINYNRKVRVSIPDCIVSCEKRGKPPADNLYRGTSTANCTQDGPVETI